MRKLPVFFLVTLLCLSLLSFFPQGIAQEKTYLKIFEKDGTYLKIPTISLSDSVVSYQETRDFYQFNITLSKPPSSNIFSFPLETEGLKFYPQPPLDKELNPTDYDFLNATHAISKEETLYRPENVVGSYAIYREDGKTGNKYMTGKLYHIYTPLIIDAKGNRIWGQLEVTKTSLTITVDEKWLAEAVYPVVIDPSFGKTAIGASTHNGSYDYIRASHYTLSEAGTITSMSIYGKIGADTASMKLLIYNLSGTAPASKLVESDVVTVSTTLQWYNFTASGDLSAAEHFLAHMFSVSGFNTYYDTGAANSLAYKTVTYPTAPDPFGTPTYGTRLTSIFANYTAGGVTPVYVTTTPTETVVPTASLSASKLLRLSSSQTTVITTECGAVKSVYVTSQNTAQPTTSISAILTKNSIFQLIMYPLTESSKWKVIYNVFSATSIATTSIIITKTVYAVTIEIFDAVLVSAIAYCTKSIGLTILDIALWDTPSPLIQMFATYPFIEISLTAEEWAMVAIILSISISLALCIGLTYGRRKQEE